MNQEFLDKVAVVIQGPIISKGRTFETNRMFYLNKFKNLDDLVVNFNSEATILKNVKQLKKLGIHKIVYSGWTTDVTSEFKKKLTRLGVKAIVSDPSSAKSYKRTGGNLYRLKDSNLDSNPLFYDNRIKQYYSFLRGLDRLKEEYDDLSNLIVIKMRSDIELDFNTLVNFICSNKNLIKKGSLIIQYLTTFKNCGTIFQLHFPDFWFVSNGKTLKDIFEELYFRDLAGKYFSASPHEDIFCSIINQNYPFLVSILSFSFPLTTHTELPLSELIRLCFLNGRFKFCKDILKRFNYYFFHIFSSLIILRLYQNKRIIPAPKEVEYSIKWRGDLYLRHILKKDKFYSDIESMRIYSIGGTNFKNIAYKNNKNE